MTATTAPFGAPDAGTGITSRMRWLLQDSWTLCRREFTQLKHQPGELIGIIVFPGLMVIMFGFVFGSAISIPGGANYREYLLPGLFAMTAITGVMVNALLVSKDVTEGVMDRFRSIPMSRGAIPLGRALTDIITSAIGLAVMVVIGLLVGWKIEDGMPRALAAFGLILLLRFALSWVGLYIGLRVSPETADAWVPIVFPISMLSNSFVPTSGMPDWLRPITEWNPISALVQSSRELFGNPVAAGSGFPAEHPYFLTIASSLALLAIFVPLAVSAFVRKDQ